MTRKKTHQVYSNSTLPTCHEETGHEDYEDWIVRREELAEVYYGRRGLFYERQHQLQGYQNHELHQRQGGVMISGRRITGKICCRKSI